MIKRYNYKRVLFTNYFENFLNQPIIATETAEEIQNLHDLSRANVYSLNKLGVKTAECGEILAHILLKKLPHSTRFEWEKHLGKSVEIPVFDTLIDFLDGRFRTLESMYPQSSKSNSRPQQSTPSKPSSQSSKPPHRRETKSFHLSAKAISCPLCEQFHILRKCPKFLEMTPQLRKACADRLNICTNCLGHSTTLACTSTKTCSHCHLRLIHCYTSINHRHRLQTQLYCRHQPLNQLLHSPIWLTFRRTI